MRRILLGAVLALSLIALGEENPSGTTAAPPVTEHCSWLDLGPSEEPLSPARWYGQGYGYWTIYAKGRVSLDLRSESGWWLGQWVDDEVWVAPPPRVVSPTGLRDEPWRRYGMALDSWVSGRVLACVRSGSAYTWGEQLTAWGSPYTALPVSRACEAPRVEDCE
jgi:hypothetical protein